MAQYRSQWTGEVIDDAVGKAKNIEYVTAGVDAQGAFEKAEAAYGIAPIYAKYVTVENYNEIACRCVEKETPGGQIIYRFEGVDNMQTQWRWNLTKNEFSSTPSYSWNGPFKTQLAGREDMSRIVAFYESSRTASHNIAKGQYLILSSSLYTADVDISTGTQLVLSGSSKNITRITDGGLNDLKSAIDNVENDLSAKATVFTDKNQFTFQGYLNGNGNYQSDTGFLTTDYINIAGYTKFTMTATTMGNLSNVVFYDANGGKVAKYTGSGSAATNTFSLPIPSTAKTARISILGTDSVNVVFQSVQSKPLPITYWLALGDSITVGYGNDGISYADYAAERLGVTLNKQATSGITLSGIYGAIANGDYDGIKPNIITILAGTNDWNINKKAKTNDNDTIYTANTYLAYVNTTIETLRAKQPQAHIIFLSCLQRNYFGEDAESIRGTINGLGETLEDYKNALYTGCNMHGVPVIDLYSESGICGQNLLPAESGYNTPSVYLYTIDGLHPNEAGHKRIADIVAGKLLNFII